MPGPGAIVFLDFDGTITRRDATDAILEAFADPAWKQIEAAWVAGRIGSRECLAAQIALVTATREQVDRLLDEIDVAPGFTRLLDVCAARAVPVHVVSDGFDHCIRQILGRPALNLAARAPGLQVVSSSLHPEGGRWRATFAHPSDPCAHGCATCKPAAMERLNAVRAVSVFVGDGLSDRYAAASADIVFAKDTLAVYCESAAIPYAPFGTLAAVADGIDRLLETARRLPRSLSGKAFPTV
jgi:2,3-diketo-5-methylthio-1-phosphopentane phosphatase